MMLLGLIMKNKLIMISLLLICGFCIFRASMLFSTKNLIKYVEKIMRNEIPLDEIKGTIYEHFHPLSCYPIDTDYFYSDVTINVGWIIHDLNNGEINIIYNVNYYDDEKRYGGSHAPSKWLIEKQNGKWEIVKIIEKP